MDPIDYLRALRRWWVVIAMLTLIGVLAAFVTAPKNDATTYEATHILVQDGTASDAVSLARASFLTTSGDVLARVSKELGEDPRVFLEGVTAVPDETLNGLRITAVEDTPARAVKVADAFATALRESLDARTQASKQAAIDRIKANIATLTVQLAAATSPQDREAVEAKIDAANGELDSIETQAPSTSGLATLQSAVPSQTSQSTSARTRLVIGAIMGLLIGVVVALVLTRFDTRIRTKEAAEEAFGVQVLGEVPPLKRKHRSKKAVIAVADPESLSAEVYRGVRTALVVASRARATTTGSDAKRRGRQRPLADQPVVDKLVVVVASPGMGEGKTTTSANLAVAFAESGRSVLLLGCDLRRPELHNYFQVPDAPGFTEELAKPPGQRSLDNIIVDTGIPGVRIVPSGEPVEHPGELLARGLDLIGSASKVADVVVIDTAPLLATDDASVLVPLADAVVVVCRSGRTSIEAATRARELLTRLHAPLVGAVLIGAQQLASARSYYRVDYRSRTRSRTAPTPGHDPTLPVGVPTDVGSTADVSGGGAGEPLITDTPVGSNGAAGDAHDRESSTNPSNYPST
jgi:capsular exopolysaccharide synthesis family protein